MKASFFYFFSRALAAVLYKTVWRLHVRGRRNIPEEGPVIIASNHRSLADPPLIGVSVPRPVHFIAKKELFRFRPFGWLISSLNAHPINRRSAAEAIRGAEKLLSTGAAVVLFPEGGRSRTDDFRPAKGGAAMLAIRAGCPVVPAYIRNSGALSRFRRLRVTFGRPIDPSRFKDPKSLTNEIMKKIAEMRDGAQ